MEVSHLGSILNSILLVYVDIIDFAELVKMSEELITIETLDTKLILSLLKLIPMGFNRDTNYGLKAYCFTQYSLHDYSFKCLVSFCLTFWV
jgi:hypothetical protein